MVFDLDAPAPAVGLNKNEGTSPLEESKKKLILKRSQNPLCICYSHTYNWNIRNRCNWIVMVWQLMHPTCLIFHHYKHGPKLCL